jgi:hypothetical protein
MTTIALLAIAWLALIVWVTQLPKACAHPNLRGVANYFDDDLRCFVHLKQCDDCDATVITTER